MYAFQVEVTLLPSDELNPEDKPVTQTVHVSIMMTRNIVQSLLDTTYILN